MASLSSFARTAPRAVFGSAAARAQEFDRIDETVRVPLPLSRRIGFVQVRGGAGASSTAAYVANVIARRRPGPVLGVDASRGRVGMLAYAGLPGSGPPYDALVGEGRPPAGAVKPGRPADAEAFVQGSSVRRATARRIGDAVDGLPRSASGLWAMALDDGHVPGAPASAQEWFDACGPISRFFDVVVTDWGVREPRIDLAQAAAASHVLCVVARADRHAAEQAVSVVDAIRATDDAPVVVVCLVDVGGTAGRAPDLVAEAADCAVLSIPFDRVRSTTGQVGSTTLATRTRLAYGRLAQQLVGDAASTTARAAGRVQAPASPPEPDRAAEPASGPGPAAVAMPPAAREHGRRAASVTEGRTG